MKYELENWNLFIEVFSLLPPIIFIYIFDEKKRTSLINPKKMNESQKQSINTLYQVEILYATMPRDKAIELSLMPGDVVNVIRVCGDWSFGITEDGRVGFSYLNLFS